MSTFDEALLRLRPKSAATRALGVERLAMFGSVATDEPRPDSDADVLVRLAEGGKIYERFLDLAEPRGERRSDEAAASGVSCGPP